MYRRYRRVGGKRYSFETTNINILSDGNHPAAQMGYVITPPVQSYGKRKVKNFTLTLSADDNLDQPIVGALVYVPEGTIPTELSVTGNDTTQPNTVRSSYEPSQNVIMSFILKPGQSLPLTKKSALARNLDSSDRIMLIIKPYGNLGAQTQFVGTCSYAIKY